MLKRSPILFAALALTVGALAATAPAAAASARHAPPRALPSGFVPGGPFRQAPGTHPRSFNGHNINYSSNWSGYAVTGTTFTTATASWTQTAVTCPSGSQFSSPWVGIDGYSSSTVEQTGSDGDCLSGRPSYYAWYEMFPRGTQVINKPVHAGDQFTGTVTHNSGTNYTLTLTDTTQGWTNTVHKSISARNNSAEAVMERDGNKLADFGTGPFSSFTVDGKPIGSYTGGGTTVWQMFMRVSGTLCDSTSGINNTDNFTVTWMHEC